MFQQKIDWITIHMRAPPLREIWELAVKSMKIHLEELPVLTFLKYEENLEQFR